MSVIQTRVNMAPAMMDIMISLAIVILDGEEKDVTWVYNYALIITAL